MLNLLSSIYVLATLALLVSMKGRNNSNNSIIIWQKGWFRFVDLLLFIQFITYYYSSPPPQSKIHVIPTNPETTVHCTIYYYYYTDDYL